MSTPEAQRVLFLSGHRFLTRPSSGGQRRHTDKVRDLAKHTSLLFVADRDRGFEQQAADLSAAGATAVPINMPRLAHPNLDRITRLLTGQWYRDMLRPGGARDCGQQVLRQLERQFSPDWVWYDTIDMLWRFGLPQDAGSVLDFYDIQYHRYERMLQTKPALVRALFGKDATRLRGLERLIASSVDWCVTCSDADRAELGVDACWVIPNGYQFPMPGGDHECDEPEARSDVLFIGLLTYQPNLDGLRWFCREVWPRIRDRHPATTLHIVGASEPGAIRDLSRAGNGVAIHGFVEDTTPIWQQCRALVVPLRVGSGTRIKILEAWSRKVAVVSTSVGAEGLGATPGVEFLLADSSRAFAEAVTRILDDPATATALADAGYVFGLRRYSREAVEDAMGAFVNRLRCGG